MVSIGTVLHQSRIFSELSIEEAEDEAKVRNLQDIESGAFSPSVEVLEKLASIYGINLSAMFTIVEKSRMGYMSPQEIFCMLADAWKSGKKDQ